MDIRTLLVKLGYKNLVSADWDKHVDTWRNWYQGLTDWHKYSVYNGIDYVPCTRLSLHMAKKAAEDKADLLLNERVQIYAQKMNEPDDSKDTTIQDALDNALKFNKFWVKGNQLVEFAHALGTAAFVEYMDEKKMPRIDYVTADNIYPLAWTKSGITECAFCSERKVGADIFYYVQLHVLRNGKYVVINKMFDVMGADAALPQNVKPEVLTDSDKPLFQIVTPNVANNIDITCPMGISVFANSLDTLRAIDTAFDSYQNEFNLGRKRLFVDASMLQNVQVPKTTMDGTVAFTQQPVFDPNDTVFYNIQNQGDAPDKKPIYEVDFKLRSTDHELGLKNFLEVYSQQCGFGKGYYKWEQGNVQTATAVISQNSELYRKISKDELLLEDVLTDVAAALLRLLGHDNLNISVSFDDSIIEDTEAKAKRAMLEFNSGLIDEVKYYERVYDMSEDAALKEVAKMQTRKPKEPEVGLLDSLLGA